MSQIDRDALKRLAGKYIWWKTPDDAVDMPERVIAQVMAIGDYADVQQLVHQVGDDVLREVIAHAQAAGCARMDWRVKPTNEAGIRFYRCFGAAPVAHRASFRLMLR